MVERVPTVVEQLLANIPRLELVREILRLYPRAFAGGKASAETAKDDAFPWGARALKIALDYDILESESGNRPSPHRYPSRHASAGMTRKFWRRWRSCGGAERKKCVVHELTLRDIAAGMLFGEDVKSAKGLLLIARGQEVTPSLLERVRNFSSELGIREPIRMIERLPVATNSQLVPVQG